MEHDEEEDIPPTVYSLEELLEYLRLPKKTSSDLRHVQFNYFNKILASTKLPESVDCILWLGFFIFIEFIFSTVAIQTQTFERLNPIFSQGIQTSATLFSKVIAQLSTVIVFGITLIIIIFQTRIPTSPKKYKIGHLRASFLHVCFVHLPIFLNPVYGFLFGMHLMTNAGIESDDHLGTYYALLSAVSFIMLSGTTAVFTSTTKNRLTISNYPFEHWVFPYNFVDTLYFFLLGTFFPIRNSIFEESVYGMMAVQFVWGFYFLKKRKEPAFLYITPSFIENKVAVDSILFSIITVNHLLNSFDYLIKLSFVFLCHFSSMIISFIIVSRNKVLSKSPLKHRSFSVDKHSISNPSEAVSVLRSSLMLSIPTINDTEFIKWIALYRFSPNLLPDLYRLCLVLKKPLKEILVPRTAFESMDLLSFQFMAFQIEAYLQMIKDETPDLYSTISHLNRINEKIDMMLTNFCTTTDLNQTTFYKLGCGIRNAKIEFSEALSNFPLSKRILQIHKQFYVDTLKMPKYIEKEPDTPFFYLANPKKIIYGYLVSKGHSVPSLDVRPLQSPDEKTAEETIKKGSMPLIYMFRILVIISMLTIILFWSLFYSHINQMWGFFLTISSYQQAGVALSTSLLSATDKLMAFPDPQTIQLIIGLPIELSALFRAPMELANPFSFVLNQIGPKLPIDFDYQWPNGTCDQVSFTTFLSYDIETDIDINHRQCHLMNAMVYSDLIENISKVVHVDFLRKADNKYTKFTLWVFSVIAIVIICFFALFYLTRKRHDRLLSAIRLVLSSKPNYHENEYLDIQFWLCPTLTLVILICTATIGLYLSFLFPTLKSNHFIGKILNETISVSRIVKELEIALSLTEFSIKTNDAKGTYYKLVKQRCSNVYESVNYLTENDISSVYSQIEPLNNWTTRDRNSYSVALLDTCRLLLQGDHSEESFDFLSARAYFMYNVTILMSHTLPEMFQASHYSVQSELSFFWWITVMLMLLILLLHVLYVFLMHERMKLWFTTATIVLLRNKHGDLKNLVERKEVPLLDLAPFPIVIKQKRTGIIMYANPATRKYTDLTIDQLIGQRFDWVWSVQPGSNRFLANDRTVLMNESNVYDRSSLMVEDDETVDRSNALSMIFFDDITEFCKIQEKYEQLIQQTRINDLSLPVEMDMIYIEVRINAEMLNVDSIFDLFDKSEVKCPSLIRISCGPSFYNAYVPTNTPIKQIISFLNIFVDLINKVPPAKSNRLQNPSENFFNPYSIFKYPSISPGKKLNSPIMQPQNQQIKLAPLLVDTNSTNNMSMPIQSNEQQENFNYVVISVVHSNGKIISLCENNTMALVCGDAAVRSHDSLLYGAWGRIYIDFDLLSGDLGKKYQNIEKKIVQISKTSLK